MKKESTYRYCDCSDRNQKYVKQSMLTTRFPNEDHLDGARDARVARVGIGGRS